ncbi:hypothetical protein WN55_02189 [Dufourea novaeangliae]|uniref:Uncharacterized protein n=1 Tax=Dufourea novaeangliae TaxID=178035 RepID=A0A154PFR3_DUFNO|nr:hypothetical protein WN55_02189 [Dufourea novaeangliae]
MSTQLLLIGLENPRAETSDRRPIKEHLLFLADRNRCRSSFVSVPARDLAP